MPVSGESTVSVLQTVLLIVPVIVYISSWISLALWMISLLSVIPLYFVTNCLNCCLETTSFSSLHQSHFRLKSCLCFCLVSFSLILYLTIKKPYYYSHYLYLSSSNACILKLQSNSDLKCFTEVAVFALKKKYCISNFHTVNNCSLSLKLLYLPRELVP